MMFGRCSAQRTMGLKATEPDAKTIQPSARRHREEFFAPCAALFSFEAARDKDVFFVCMIVTGWAVGGNRTPLFPSYRRADNFLR